MKYQDKVPEFKISQFDFAITPLQITFSLSHSQAYSLQFCKGPQLFKKFKENIWVQGNQKAFKFSISQSAIFKIQNQKSLVYEWAIYKINDEDLKDHIVSINTDISQIYLKFIQEFKKIGRQYYKLINNAQQNLEVAQQWQKHKLNIPNRRIIHAIDKSLGIDISFKVDIKCELDMIIQKMKKKEKKMVKSTSKASNQICSHPSIDEELIAPQKLTFQTNLSNNQQEKIRKLIPLNKTDALSDIIEASKQSTILNQDQKNPKLHSIVSQIRQQQQIPSPLHPSIRTQCFDRLSLTIKEMKHFQQKSKTSGELSIQGENQKQMDQDDKAYEKMLKSTQKNNKTIIKKEEDYREKQQYFQGLETAPHSQLKEETITPNKLNQQKIEEEVHHKPVRHKLIKIAIVFAVLALSYYLAVSQNQFGFTSPRFNIKLGKKKQQNNKQNIKNKKQQKQIKNQKKSQSISKNDKKERVSKQKLKPQKKQRSLSKGKTMVEQPRKFKIQDVQQTSTLNKKSREKIRPSSRKQNERQQE